MEMYKRKVEISYQEKQNRLLEELRKQKALRNKRIKILISGMAVAGAFLSTPKVIQEVQKEQKTAKSTLVIPKLPSLDIFTDLISKVKESIKIGIASAEELVAQATPVVEEYYSQVGEVVKPTSTAIAPSREVEGSQNQTFTKKLEITQTPTVRLDNVQVNATPMPFGKELEGLSFVDITVEQNISNERPFDIKQTNDVLQDLGLEVKDLLNPELSRINDFREINDPSIPTLAIFSDDVMRWAPLVEKVVAENNIKYPDSPVSSNLVLTIMTMESQGNENAVSPTGAVGLMQLTSIVYSGVFNLNRSDITNPETNIRVGVEYLSQTLKYNKKTNLTGLDELYVAAMEYNGGEAAALNIYNGFGGPEETKRYGRIFLRFATVANIATELKNSGFEKNYSEMLSSKLFDSLISNALRDKYNYRAMGKSGFELTGKILQKHGEKEFNPGIVTRKLFLEEIEEEKIGSDNPALKAMKKFEYA